MVGYLKVRRSQWSGPVSYGLGAGGFAAIILLSISSLGALPKPQPQITADNIESHIRTWVDYFGLAIQKTINPGFILRAHGHATKQQPDNGVQAQGT